MGTTSLPWFGNVAIGEVLVYNREFTDREREDVESYLCCRYLDAECAGSVCTAGGRAASVSQRPVRLSVVPAGIVVTGGPAVSEAPPLTLHDMAGRVTGGLSGVRSGAGQWMYALPNGKARAAHVANLHGRGGSSSWRIPVRP